ncbi:MAG: hypothetical protein R3E13_10290 [Alphaproteobacteria bacterium]
MSVNENKALVDSALTLGGAVLGAAGEAIKDGTALEAIKGATAQLTASTQKTLDSAKVTIKSIDPKDITPKSLEEAFNTSGGFTGIVELAESAGIKISAGAVEAVFNKAAKGDEYKSVYNHFFGSDSQDAQKEQPGFLAILMGLLSGNTDMAMNAISGWFDGMMGKLSGLPGKAQQQIGGFVDQIKSFALSFAGPVMDKFAPMVADLGARFGFGGDGEEAEVQVADAGADTSPATDTSSKPSVQTAQNNSGGLDNAHAQGPFHTASAPSDAHINNNPAVSPGPNSPSNSQG